VENVEKTSLQDRVNEIANTLLASGTKPSVRLVLAELPDVNSTSTVHKYFSNWKREIESNQQSLYDRLGFSPEFTQSFMKEITRFGVEAEQRYKQQAEDANEQKDHAVADLSKAEEKLHKQTAVVEQQEKQIIELKAELSDSLKKAQADLDKEQRANEATVNELRQQLAAALDENKDLTKQSETLRTGLAKAELKLESNQELVEEVKGQNQQHVIEAKELNRAISELNKDIAAKDSTIAGNEKLISNLQEQQDKSSKEMQKLSDQTSKEVQKLSNTIRKLEDELDNARKELSSANSKLSEQISANNETKANLEDKLRNYEQTVRSYEATIAGNEKLIAQLEKNQ